MQKRASLAPIHALSESPHHVTIYLIGVLTTRLRSLLSPPTNKANLPVIGMQ